MDRGTGRARATSTDHGHRLPFDSTSGPFRGAEACREGRTTRKRLRGPAFVPLYPDTDVGAELDVTLAVRRLALRTWLGDDVVIAGSLAADAFAVPLVDEVAEVIVPSVRRVRHQGLLAHRYSLEPFEVVEVEGVRVTSPDGSISSTVSPWPTPSGGSNR